MNTMNLNALPVEELTNAEMTQVVGGSGYNSHSYESEKSKSSFGLGLSLDFGLFYEKEYSSKSYDSHGGKGGHKGW